MRVGPHLSVSRETALDELRATLAALTARVALLEAEKHASPRVRRADRARLERLLPAIAGTLGSEPFTVAELFEQTSVRLVFEPPFESSSGEERDRAQVGRLLERAIGIPIDGYVVAKVGTELHRRLWTVTAAV